MLKNNDKLNIYCVKEDISAFLIWTSAVRQKKQTVFTDLKATIKPRRGDSRIARKTFKSLNFFPNFFVTPFPGTTTEFHLPHRYENDCNKNHAQNKKLSFLSLK